MIIKEVWLFLSGLNTKTNLHEFTRKNKKNNEKVTEVNKPKIRQTTVTLTMQHSLQCCIVSVTGECYINGSI